MARVVILTDRMPGDLDWKGDVVWQIVRSLAESQHDVQVFTTEDPDQVPFSHPRMNVARPANSWGVETLLKWTQAILSFKPDVIHTFALKPQKRWSWLSIFPILSGTAQLLPVTRVCTFFEPQDFNNVNSSLNTWYLHSQHWTVFTSATEFEARKRFCGRIDVVPWGEVWLPDHLEAPADHFAFVPSPVSEWTNPEHGLVMLADWLRRSDGLCAFINGGLGSLRLAERRKAWSRLAEVSAQVRMLEPLNFTQLGRYIGGAQKLWLACEPRTSWRMCLSLQVAQQLAIPTVGAPEVVGSSKSGSTANFLSRLYCS